VGVDVKSLYRAIGSATGAAKPDLPIRKTNVIPAFAGTTLEK
jgi:hypothetical protein